MLDEELLCPSCGMLTQKGIEKEKEEKSVKQSKKSAREVKCLIAAILMFATCLLLITFSCLGFSFYLLYAYFYIFFAIFYALGGQNVPLDWLSPDNYMLFLVVLLPILWIVPMAVVLLVRSSKNKKIGVFFKICTLLFCSLPAGIILFFVKNEQI